VTPPPERTEQWTAWIGDVVVAVADDPRRLLQLLGGSDRAAAVIMRPRGHGLAHPS
jgi:hypothetical protein